MCWRVDQLSVVDLVFLVFKVLEWKVIKVNKVYQAYQDMFSLHRYCHIITLAITESSLWEASSLHVARGIAETKCIFVTAVCVSVCLSVPRRIPALLNGRGCNLGNGRRCPVRYCALFGGFSIGARVSLLWQHSAEREMSASACTRFMAGCELHSVHPSVHPFINIYLSVCSTAYLLPSTQQWKDLEGPKIGLKVSRCMCPVRAPGP